MLARRPPLPVSPVSIVWIALLASGCAASEAGAPDGGPDSGSGAGEPDAGAADGAGPGDAEPEAPDDAGDSGAGGDGDASGDAGEGDATDAAPDAGVDAGETAEPEPVPAPEPEPPCESDADCDDEDLCTTDRCLPGGEAGAACGHEPVACAGPGDPCLAPACEPSIGCRLDLVPSEGCCFEEVVAGFGFESPTPGLAVKDLAPGGLPPASWQASTARAYTGQTSYWFGIEGLGHYDNGEVVAGKLSLPKTALPADTRPELRFHVFADVEKGPSWDLLLVEANAGEGPVPLWIKDGSNLELGVWQAVVVDLAAFAGSEVTISFTFDSVDDSFNDTEGVYLDDVWVLTACGGTACRGDADCDDGVACTSELCAGGSCAYDASSGCCTIDAQCFDGDACTIDACAGLVCSNAPVGDPDCCSDASDCDDGNACTLDLCLPGEAPKCSHEVSTSGGCCAVPKQCDDGDPCTLETCESNACVFTPTCCEKDADCEDGDPCTTDTCAAGTCTSAPSGAPGCCALVSLSEAFESGAPGWTFTGGGGGCHFQVVSFGQSFSGTGALYYGDPAAKDYDCGKTAGAAISPPVQLEAGVPHQVEAMVWLDVEPNAGQDDLSLNVISPGGEKTLWKKDAEPMFTWFSVKADLTPYAGSEVTLRWKFATGDQAFNTGEGVYVDDFRVTSTCEKK